MWHQWFNCNFYEVTRIPFVRKENKNNDFIQQFVSSASPYSAFLESITYVNNVCCSVSAAPYADTYVVYAFIWDKLLNEVGFFLFSLRTKSIFVASQNYGWTTDVTWIVLTLIVLGSLLSMEGQRALGIHQKYLNLCSEDERRSYRFGTTWGWVINDRIFIFGRTIPLNMVSTVTNTRFMLVALEVFYTRRIKAKFQIHLSCCQK